MAGKGLGVCAVVIGLTALPVFGERAASGENCSFRADPDWFLEREGRAWREIADRVRKLERAALRSAATPAAAPESIPQRNVVDQEIFGKLIQRGVLSARLTTDEEFVRRIYLDLTGRLPSSADVRSFLADTTAGKRDALIDKLLYSPEFGDKWTVLM
jgi:hypothetical protein